MGNRESVGFGVVNNTQHYLTVGLSMAGTHYYENMVAPGEVFYRWPGAVWYTVYVYPTKIFGDMTDGKAVGEVLSSTALGVGAALLAGGGIMLAGGAIAGGSVAGAAVAAEEGAGAVAVAAGETTAAAGCLGTLEVSIEVAQLVSGAITLAIGIFGKLGWQIDDKTVHFLGEFYHILPTSTKKQIEDGYDSLKWDLFQTYKGRQIYTDMKGCYGGGSGTWLEVTGTGLPMVDTSGQKPKFVGRDIKLVERDFDYVKSKMDKGQWKFTSYSRGKYMNE